MTSHSTQAGFWKRFLPFLLWLPQYRLPDLSADLVAAVVVTVMLIPQSLAYAALAGLPPEVGLYSSILPLAIYGLMGSSRYLAIAPTAITSILVLTGLSSIATVGSADYIHLAALLALMIGVFRVVMGLAHIGFVVNFLSQPVLSGFTSGAAILIAFSQIKVIMGISLPQQDSLFVSIGQLFERLGGLNVAALGIGVLSVILLILFKSIIPVGLDRLRLPKTLRLLLGRMGPLAVVIVAVLITTVFQLDEQYGLAIVAAVPQHLPTIALPQISETDLVRLLPTALTITVIGYMEAISMAKVLASKRRERIDPDQELIGLGFSNIAAAISGGFPVGGSLSRSSVNFEAGARSGMASVLAAIMVAAVVVLLTPLFYYLPHAALAAVILVAIVKLIDIKTFRRAWSYSRADAMSWLLTFGAALVFGIELCILIGLLTSISLHLWRTSKPHYAILGRIPGTEHFRNVERYENLETCQHVLAIRIDESLYFANVQFLDTKISNLLAERPEVTDLLLVLSAVNFIDSSALLMMEDLLENLKDLQVRVHLSEVKGPVMDRLGKTRFIEKIGAEHIYLSTYQAMSRLNCIEGEIEEIVL